MLLWYFLVFYGEGILLRQRSQSFNASKQDHSQIWTITTSLALGKYCPWPMDYKVMVPQSIFWHHLAFRTFLKLEVVSKEVALGT